MDERSLVALLQCSDPAAVVRWLRGRGVAVVAVDSPRAPAPDGALIRQDERAFLAARICGLRATPDAARVEASDYYGWVRGGLRLYEALAAEPWEVVECFPTASWTRWLGERVGTRAAWTTRGLARLGLHGVPVRHNQDVRDAIAAAVTARQHGAGLTEQFGAIVVPRTGTMVSPGSQPGDRGSTAAEESPDSTGQDAG